MAKFGDVTVVSKRGKVHSGSRGGWSYYYMHGAAPTRNTWPLQPSFKFQPAESADHILCRSKTIRTDIIRNVRSIIIQ